MASKDHLVIAAIDFGTTYSGYAFSWKHDFKTDPLKIHANQAWTAGGRQLLSLKAPTCLLLNGKQEIEAFGYDAENRYADLLDDDENKVYYFFHRFKMSLHNNKDISSEMVIEDVSGKPVSAMVVFSTLIKALKNHLLDHLKSSGKVLTMKDVFWVLTVPAIWSDKAKQFMRKSAEEAGIPRKDLLISLEPEAASVCCQYLPTEKLQESDAGFVMFGTGTKYMVADIGGGTLDVTVHEKLANGNLRELTSATGNDCGGTSVDDRFFQFLVSIFGCPLLMDLKKEQTGAYLDLFREFETVKRTITTTREGKVSITVPYVAINELCKKHYPGEELPDIVASSSKKDWIGMKGDKLRIDSLEMKNLFKPTIEGIIGCIQKVLERKEARGITHILVVGGFADCSIVKEAMMQNFKDKKVLIPEDAGLAVLKGAVIFGHNPYCIKSRVMQCTYGVERICNFDHRVHKEAYKVKRNGIEKCTKIFDTIVQKGQSLECTKKIVRVFTTSIRNQELAIISVFVTSGGPPQYTDDEGCALLGNVIINFSKTTRAKRQIEIEFEFGHTELHVTARDRISTDRAMTSLDLV